jgi:hypothetical protein
MWLLIFALTLLPIFVGMARPAIRPARLYVGLAVLIIVALVPVHGHLNDRGGRFTDEQGYKHTVTSYGMEQVSGTFWWRFFDWGVLGPGGAKPTFRFWLMDNLNVEYKNTPKLDVTNPTPFMLLLWLLLLSGLSHVFVDQRTAAGATNREP